MISIEQWRAVIGRFVITRSKCKMCATKQSNTSNVIAVALCISIVIVLCGDVELNPGPGPMTRTTKQSTFASSKQLSLTSLGSVSSPPNNASSFHTSSNKEILEAIRQLTAKVEKMECKIENFQTKLERRLEEVLADNDQLKLKCEIIDQNVSECEKRIQSAEKQIQQNILWLDNLEGQSRRNNLIFHGVNETDNENWDETEKKITDIVSNKLGLREPVVFERVHRLNTQHKPRPIIAKFSNYKQRSAVFGLKKQLHGTDVFVTEDFTRRVREIRRNLLKESQEFKAEGKRVSLVFDHLNVDGTRYDWDPEKQTCVKRNGRSTRSATWRPAPSQHSSQHTGTQGSTRMTQSQHSQRD